MKTIMKKVAVLSFSAAAMLAMAGCSGLTPSAALSLQGSALHGNVHGGQQPVNGATIQLYAAGNTGYGSAFSYAAGTSLLGTNVVTTDEGGNFSITNDYTCPTPTAEVYIVATGGNPGLPSGTNPNLAMMTLLGPCGQLSASTFVSINELTTIGSIWAVSPFMTGVANIGTTPANLLGLTNAFAAVNKLVNTGTGAIPGPALPANAVAPTAKIITLADILASCINSGGGTAGAPNNCGGLFAAATVNGVAPTDTITAAMNIAQHPGMNVSALHDLTPPSPPFPGALTTAPTDWQLAITYTGGGLAAPKALAVDVAGSVWLANTGNSVTKLDNTGAAISGTGGFTAGSITAPSAIAVDASGNAWVTNKTTNTVTKLAPAGATGTVYSGGGLSSPSSVAIDAQGAAWIANSGNASVTAISTSGTLNNYAGAGLATPVAVAINTQ